MSCLYEPSKGIRFLLTRVRVCVKSDPCAFHGADRVLLSWLASGEHDRKLENKRTEDFVTNGTIMSSFKRQSKRIVEAAIVPRYHAILDSFVNASTMTCQRNGLEMACSSFDKGCMSVNHSWGRGTSV